MIKRKLLRWILRNEKYFIVALECMLRHPKGVYRIRSFANDQLRAQLELETTFKQFWEKNHKHIRILKMPDNK